MVLSCVFRTDQQFGAGYLIDVLLGRADDRIRRNGHDTISTFGIGTQMEERTWQSVIRQLIAVGALTPTVHGGLQLTEQSRDLLEGDATLRIARPSATSNGAPRGGRIARPKPSSAPSDVLDPEAQHLFDRLRAVRLALAQEQGVPPYVVFHDATLALIAEQRPTTAEALLAVPGVGRTKLDRYGDAFLMAVREA